MSLTMSPPLAPIGCIQGPSGRANLKPFKTFLTSSAVASSADCSSSAASSPLGHLPALFLDVVRSPGTPRTPC